MIIIEINTLENGSHRNQTGTFKTIPDGWAVVPEGMETPNFPYGEVTVEKIDGITTVTKWIPKNIEVTPFPIPKFEDAEETETSTVQDDIDAMLIDHEYRLTLIELGVIE